MSQKHIRSRKKKVIGPRADKKAFMSVRMAKKKGKRKAQGVPQPQTAAPPRPQKKEKTDKSKQAQIEQTYEKHQV